MARILSLLLVLGLLGGTAAAFAITEGLKLEKSPIGRTQVTKLFSPTCDCPKDVAKVAFTLRNGDTMTVSVIDGDGNTVDTLAHHYFRRGRIRPLEWTGRDSQGIVVPDGVYKLRIHLANRHQTITLPNTIQVKTTAPTIAITHVVPRIFSPDRDGRSEYVSVSFTVSGTARPLLYVDGKQVGRGRLAHASGKLNWYGGAHGERYPAGVYALSLRAEDRAGNISPPTRDVPVRIRFLALGRKVIHVRRGRAFSLRVLSDAKAVQYVLHGASGAGAPGMLRLRAPKKPGTYRLVVTAVDHSEAATVVVSK